MRRQKKNKKKYSVELSDKLSDFQFSINETVYALPAKLQEWKNAGWTYEKDNGKKALDPESFLEGEALDSEGGSLQWILSTWTGRRNCLVNAM